MNRLSVITAYLGSIRDKFLTYQKERDLFEKLSLASQIENADGVELCYPADFGDFSQLKNLLKRFNLTVSSINFRSRRSGAWMRGSFSSEHQNERQEVSDDLKRAMSCALELGCRLITTCPLNDGSDTPFDIDYSRAMDNAAESLSRACESNREVRISLEYKISEPKTRCLFGNAGETLSFCNLSGIPNLGVTLDFGHSLLAQERPAQTAVLLSKAKKLFHIHLNDNDNRADWDLIPGSFHLWEFVEFIYTLNKLEGKDRWFAFDVTPKEIEPVQNFSTVMATTRKLEEITSRIDEEAMEQLLKKRNPALTVTYLYSLI
ncbi:MAG: sugar phosphate isomerase/epimerase [Spirochaetaceae bacterium]|nr:MAG: sugar phosphate isomerase/epimerase [Spirochaetaceae bacterium]